MEELNPEIVCNLIHRAKEFHAKEGLVIPETDLTGSPGDNWSPMLVLEDHKGDLTYQEFKERVNDLEPDQQIALVTLMWIGRGDYTKDDWDEAYAEAESQWTKQTAEYLLAHPLLASYLEEGLAAFDYSCDDIIPS